MMKFLAEHSSGISETVFPVRPKVPSPLEFANADMSVTVFDFAPPQNTVLCTP